MKICLNRHPRRLCNIIIYYLLFLSLFHLEQAAWKSERRRIHKKSSQDHQISADDAVCGQSSGRGQSRGRARARGRAHGRGTAMDELIAPGIASVHAIPEATEMGNILFF